VAGTPYYESARGVEEYLFFHYGEAAAYLPFRGSPRAAWNYPERAVKELLDRKRLPREARALDLGCAVGRSSFALSRVCAGVVGIDLSRAFIRAAKRVQRDGTMPFTYAVEGERRAAAILHAPKGCHPERITFRVGDAMRLSPRLGRFDVAVLLNLIDRVPDPALCLERLTERLNPGAQLIIASPYTWMTDYTPRATWLGGRDGAGTFAALRELLTPHFTLIRRRQLPFILREHARKYQWSVAEGTCWVKRAG
jgi:putative 4-mercaptohistidine N1-methyltranferase